MNFLADSNRRRDAIVAAGADPQRLRADELEPLVYAVGGATDDPALAAPSAATLLRHLFAVNQKRDREPAVAAALMTLDSPPTSPASMLRALLVLLYAEEFAQAESRLLRMLTAGEVCPVFAMLLARIVACQGRSREAAGQLGTLLGGDLRADLIPAAVAWRVSALVDLGELEQANELLRLHGYDGELVDVPDRPELLAARGALHLAEGRFGLAYDDYSACGRELTAWAVVNPAVANWRAYAALCAHMTRRNWLAKTLASDELAAARSWGGRRTSGIALQVSARLAPDEQARMELLESADSELAGSGALLEQIRVKYDLAVLRAERSDDASALALLGTARALADEVGNDLWRDRIAAAINQLEGAPGPARLTPQELAVAREVQPGRTNRQIAEHLCLTVRTIEFHLSSVYRKLGISGRRELQPAILLTQEGRRTRLQPIIW
ncbi:LuxR C-terminal-related transcriptional regulator [Kribbella sp. NPDC051587]|uniref:helix-turn-helix transcriptional regulator n=1 Tax=Kribbella sp. NPDC051587 TaxID=3364119 RepID=UPI00378957FB